MSDLFINFITLHPACRPTHLAITHVGLMFRGVGSLMWQLRAATAIELIESDVHGFHFIDPIACRRREVQVRRTDGRIPYLCARLKAKWTDELLNLPSLVYPPDSQGVYPPPIPAAAPCNERNIA